MNIKLSIVINQNLGEVVTLIDELLYSKCHLPYINQKFLIYQSLFIKKNLDKIMVFLFIYLIEKVYFYLFIYLFIQTDTNN